MKTFFPIPILILALALILPSCGERNPLLGTWRLEGDSLSPLVKLILKGDDVTLEFKKTEYVFSVDGKVNLRERLTYKKIDGEWGICDEEGKNCAAVPIGGDRLEFSFPEREELKLVFRRA
ncbi:MAG: hypothetical protein LBF41_01210 [Deltaproteobacteria bacterium]|jgi:hypothetical protein|nr:hypothetical protein [Deltaproteobacteria bacterium]